MRVTSTKAILHSTLRYTKNATEMGNTHPTSKVICCSPFGACY